MNDEDKTKEELISELAMMRQKATQLEWELTALKQQQDSNLTPGAITEATNGALGGAVLAESKKRLERILSSNPAVIYAAKPYGDYEATFISDNLTAQLGYEPREFLEDPSFWASRVYPEDVERVLEGLSQLFELDHHVHEYRFRHKDGSYRWMRDELNLIRDENGAPVEIVGYWIEITERRQMEEELRVRDSVIKASINGIGFADPNGTIIGANDAFVKMWGFDRHDDVLGLHASECWDDSEALSRAFAEFEEKGYYVGELTAKKQDGKTFDAQLSASAVFDDNGKPICLMVSVLDITDRKKLEEALRASEIRYRAIFEGASDGIVVADLQTLRYRYVNQTMCDMVGYARDELTRRGVYDMHPKDAMDHILGEFEAHAKGEKFRSADVPFLRKDGSILLVEASSTFMEVDGASCIVGFFRDITDRKKMERERERIIAQLQQALADVKRLSGLLPICASCKKIRNDKGYWQSIETYISEHSEAQFSHGICLECAKKLYPDLFEDDPDPHKT